jgi:hypothetical protein
MVLSLHSNRIQTTLIVCYVLVISILLVDYFCFFKNF